MEQLSFLSAIERKEAAPPSVWERMAAGLKSQRMGAVDRIEHLTEQVRRQNEIKERPECGKDDLR